MKNIYKILPLIVVILIISSNSTVYGANCDIRIAPQFTCHQGDNITLTAYYHWDLDFDEILEQFNDYDFLTFEVKDINIFDDSDSVTLYKHIEDTKINWKGQGVYANTKVNTSKFAPGNYTINVAYSGDSKFPCSNATSRLTVLPRDNNTSN